MSGRNRGDGDVAGAASEGGSESDRLLVYPCDGYRINHHLSELNQREELYLELYGGGQLLEEPLLIMYAPFKDTDEIAELRRSLPLYQAICRYCNAGGDVGTASDVASDMFVHMRTLKTQLTLPPGYKLLDVIEKTQRQNLIMEPGGDVLVITEGEWAERWSQLSLSGRVQGELIPSAEEFEHGDQPRLQHQENPESEDED